MLRPVIRSRVLVAALLPIALALPACGGDGGGTVEVTLQEFAVVPASSSIGTGSVTFEATNDGPDDDHELVVIRTDLGLTALPTSEDGSVDEAGEGIEVIGEIEEFAPGDTESATFNLVAGAYVLICNIYDATEDEAHYQEGMRVGFTVT